MLSSPINDGLLINKEISGGGIRLVLKKKLFLRHNFETDKNGK